MKITKVVTNLSRRKRITIKPFFAKKRITMKRISMSETKAHQVCFREKK